MSNNNKQNEIDLETNNHYKNIFEDTRELLGYVAIETSLQKILDKIVKLAEARNPGTYCSILILDSNKKQLLNGSAQSLPKYYNDAIHGIEIGETIGSCGSAAFKKERVIVENIDLHENWQPYLELTQKANLHACWSEPIFSMNNQVLGTFAIYNTKPKSPTVFELELIEAYANIASKAIEKSRYLDEQAKNQELTYTQSKLVALEELLSNIAHQWRQPLSIISTIATGIKVDHELGVLDNNKIIEKMDIIHEHVQNLSTTIDNFRKFFHLNEKEKDQFNLQDSISSVVNLIKESYSYEGITTVVNTEDCPLVFNQSIFIQAILNILNNAKDALVISNKNDKYIFIDLIKKEEKYQLTIKDTGNGIAEDMIDKIFEPYFTTKHKSQGTGIGLYMTNQIITKHLNATIKVKNINFKYNNKTFFGACFTISIPCDVLNN